MINIVCTGKPGDGLLRYSYEHCCYLNSLGVKSQCIIIPNPDHTNEDYIIILAGLVASLILGWNSDSYIIIAGAAIGAYRIRNRHTTIYYADNHTSSICIFQLANDSRKPRQVVLCFGYL